jgi:hypothetical protein
MLVILLSGVLLCCCSRKPANLIRPGADVSLKLNGASYIVHVASRKGSGIHGIRLVTKESDGTETTIIAGAGTVTESSDHNSAVINLDSGVIVSSKTRSDFNKLGPLNLVR